MSQRILNHPGVTGTYVAVILDAWSRRAIGCAIILTCHFDLESGCTFDLWADDVPVCPVEVRNNQVWVKTTFGHPDAGAHWGAGRRVASTGDRGQPQ